MNRKKKIYETLKKKDKRANAKLHKSNKPRYVSKAQRAAMQDQQPSDEHNTPQPLNETN
ncbi:hypothetical protein PSECIP111951_02432 [Pseudoalteromonas holothuriae]|uniref:DUF2986 domain-containing protein n=1 Tax=Pseudoalteromonas holothuriae TaxID=2963714 RepID=A0A9W4QUH2_9GAMM|nr:MULTISPECIES: DUF2986 domain-containing protein [unclassified Pseudoalteromonas]CAH9053648.1 hypothetical protein PSECIP111854_01211 [Pseudoalteromonas sp. CIP111854]CAH9061174.1 hypothetical protein PSECIP111951_02432 [Pseudoalteromonas sp. CIP111951]